MSAQRMSVQKEKTAVLFDIDDTLYDQVVPFGAAVRQALPQVTGISDEELFQARRRHDEISFRMTLNQQMTMEEMYRYRIQKALEDFGIAISDEQADAFQQAYSDQCRQHLSLSPIMEEMFEWCLERRAVLGVVTNGPGAHQRSKVQTLGLERFLPMENVIISGEAGYTKPDVRIFLLAQQKLGLDCRSAQIWYVGDSFVNDIEGAFRAGWKTVWMNRRGGPMPKRNMEDGTEIIPDYCACNEEELFAVIRKIL